MTWACRGIFLNGLSNGPSDSCKAYEDLFGLEDIGDVYDQEGAEVPVAFCKFKRTLLGQVPVSREVDMEYVILLFCSFHEKRLSLKLSISFSFKDPGKEVRLLGF